MITSYIGSFLIDSGRMSLAAGVSMRGWKPGLSPFMMSPIADYLECEPGMWHVIRNRNGSWTNDVFGLIHSDEIRANGSTFIPIREITSFQTWGRLLVADTLYPKIKDQKFIFNIHPDKWRLAACVRDIPQPMKWPENTKFFLIRKFLPQETRENHSSTHVNPIKDY